MMRPRASLVVVSNWSRMMVWSVVGVVLRENMNLGRVRVDLARANSVWASSMVGSRAVASVILSTFSSSTPAT